MGNWQTTTARLAAAVVLGAMLTAGCSAAAVSTSAADSASGPVDVMYAGSVVGLMQGQLGPGFQRATGDTFTGFAAGDKDLAAEIKDKVHPADALVVADPSIDRSLEGKANGDWVSWYATYATSPLILGYNPHSKFAAALETKPWYQVITQPGFRLGFSDPKTDPKGAFAVQAMIDIAAKQSLPSLKAIATSAANEYPEETLVGRLQSGQLDASFFYLGEAIAARIPTVPLTGETFKATYTVTVLNNAPHEGAAATFVRYLLGPGGRAILKRDGFTPITPRVAGSGVPSGLRNLLPR
ncbi:MAG TPA: substrate-binding domain-containing protein [Streptosporangiaceae bacterium]|nr:substrate-binding domain-containing protein [Streptosporangiaceae bacterium]